VLSTDLVTGTADSERVHVTGIEFVGGATKDLLVEHTGSDYAPFPHTLDPANDTATLANGATSVVVTHGLGVTPDIEDISVTPIEAWGAATQFWISTPTSTQFTITVDQDPGQDVDFAWTASVQ
jgi:hypothetical protein